MVSEKFRHQLRKEAERWQAEGLIDPWVHAELAHRYRFEDLESSSRDRFVSILVALGGLLLGLAVITFVAANWQAWSRSLKVGFLLSLFFSVNTAGFYLWRNQIPSWRSRLGSGLLVLGALVLGATLALMSQMFHQGGEPYQLYLFWGLGVLAMAYSLRMTLLGAVAIVVVGIGYWTGIDNLFNARTYSASELVLQHMPLLSVLLYLPLAVACRSRWLFTVAVVAVISALEVSLIRQMLSLASVSRSGRGILAAAAIALPPALLWVYRDTLWGTRIARRIHFTPTAQTLALLFVSILCYGFSFRFAWNPFPLPADRQLLAQTPGMLLDVVLLGALTLYAWGRLVIAAFRSKSWRSAVTHLLFGLVLLIAAGVRWWHITFRSNGAIATGVFNLLLLAIAISLVRAGLASGQRRSFWGGVLLLGLQLLSRMLEYNSGLLLKAIILFFSGISIIAAGLWFERYLHRFSGDPKASNQEAGGTEV